MAVETEPNGTKSFSKSDWSNMAEIRKRRSRLSKSDSPAISMSFLTTQSLDDDELEEQLHSEYVREEKKLVSTAEPDVVEPIIEIPPESNEKPIPPPERLTSGRELGTTTSSRNSVRRWWNSLSPHQKTCAKCVVFLAIYYILPLSPYFSGLLLGIFLTFLIMKLYYQLFVPSPESVASDSKQTVTHPQVPVPPLGEVVHKGWMNELRIPYSPEEYHISQTMSVFVRIHCNTLRVSHPRGKIPKHAVWNEPHHDPSFIYQRYYNLAKCRVMLLPEGLTRKRLWSKKYPVCIVLAESAKIGEKWNAQKAQCGSGSPPSVECEGAEDIFNRYQLPDPENAGSAAGEERLIFFARTGRQKEEWYWKFESAARWKGSDQPKESSSAPSSPKQQKASLSPFTESGGKQITRASSNLTSLASKETNSGVKAPFVGSTSILADEKVPYSTASYQMEFSAYMTRLIDKNLASPDDEKLDSSDILKFRDDPVWLNALLGRICWDFFHDPAWSELVCARLQKKLSKIKVPYFMDDLSVTELDLGKELPVIERIAAPMQDGQGLWVDLDIAYKGTIKITFQPKLNLMKLKKELGSSEKEPSSPTDRRSSSPPHPPRTAAFDSEEEDSAESTSDDEGGGEVMVERGEEGSPALPNLPTGQGGGSTSRKILRFVDKVTQSRYFQLATEFRYIRRAMEEVSNTRLTLSVELRNFQGTLTLNIPPPPSDRLWYGFRNNPEVTLVARPRLGEREVTLTIVTEWIEKKLKQEFQKLFVMPNMDDVPIPIMTSGILSCPPTLPSATTIPSRTVQPNV